MWAAPPACPASILSSGRERSRLDAKTKLRQKPLPTQLLTDLSRTVGMKSWPMPSTSMVVLFVLFSSQGRATMEPSGSTPMIFEGRKLG